MTDKRAKIKRILTLGFISFSVMTVSIFLPLSAKADVSATVTPGASVTDPNFQLVSTDCGKTTSSGTINKECDWSDFISLLNRILQYIIFISASIGVLMFVYAGFLYLTAFGEMGKVEQAHRIFSTTITGMIIVMVGWLIVATILKTLEVSPEFTILQDNTSTTPPPTLPSDGSMVPNV